MRKFLALALTGLFLAFAGMTGTTQAAPAGAAVDVLRLLKDTTASQTQDIRHHRRWHRHRWHRRCRSVYRCWRTPWGKRRCGWVRRCR
jgi:hypothetical protein